MCASVCAVQKVLTTGTLTSKKGQSRHENELPGQRNDSGLKLKLTSRSSPLDAPFRLVLGMERKR
eukprot:6187379-Pleurochrysis_carterae.AAC.4